MNDPGRRAGTGSPWDGSGPGDPAGLGVRVGSPWRTDRQATTIGWRLWRLRDDQLWSWAVDYVWRPGAAEAVCLLDAPLSGRQRCGSAPGPNCQCGFWGLWEPAACVTKARRDMSTGALAPHRFLPVLGLMSGWGTVAVHGTEGFRAQRGSVVCLFSEPIWDPELDRMLFGRAGLRARLAGLLRSEARRRSRWSRLRSAASRYGVPLVSLGDAVRFGVLRELGVPAHMVERLEQDGS